MNIDNLLAQATCSVIINGKPKGTAWLVSKDGYLITAGHMLGEKNPPSSVKVLFLNDIQRDADTVEWKFDFSTGIDFAVLKLKEQIPDRAPLPVALPVHADGKLRLRGYGITLKNQSAGKGDFIGSFPVNNLDVNRLFELTCKQSAEGGFSGAAIFSLKEKAVVALQTEATEARTGAGRDTILAMPLYRIAAFWKPLFDLAQNSLPVSSAPGSKETLETIIRENHQYYYETYANVNTNYPGEELYGLNLLLKKYFDILAMYLRIYLKKQEDENFTLNPDIVEIAKEVTPGLFNKDNNLKDEALPFTFIEGAKIIQVGITQIFRIADLLTKPDSVKAKKLYNAFTSADCMRRTINSRRKFKLGKLGFLQLVSYYTDKYDHFWRPALPDLRYPMNSPVCFFPYEVSITEHLKKFCCEHDSILDKELTDKKENIKNFVKNTQISGHIRIFPPGIGIVKLNITLTFSEAVNVELTSQIARNIESLMFVDTNGDEEPCDKILLDRIQEVIDQLFKKEGYGYEERRWKPPAIVFNIIDDTGVDPQKEEKKLAYLMSLAPNNYEKISDLRDRIKASLKAKHWLHDGILDVVGQGVTLLFVRSADAQGKANKRKQLTEWLIETNELVSAGIYAQEEFAEEIERISGSRLLDDTWHVKGSGKLTYLLSLLDTMRIVTQAISNIKLHLQKQGTGVLLILAKKIWTFNNPVNIHKMREGLNYIYEWTESSKDRLDNITYTALRKAIEDIKAIPEPFDYTGYTSMTPSPDILQEELESKILIELGRLCELSGFEKVFDIDQVDLHIDKIARHYRE